MRWSLGKEPSWPADEKHKLSRMCWNVCRKLSFLKFCHCHKLSKTTFSYDDLRPTYAFVVLFLYYTAILPKEITVKWGDKTGMVLVIFSLFLNAGWITTLSHQKSFSDHPRLPSSVQPWPSAAGVQLRTAGLSLWSRPHALSMLLPLPGAPSHSVQHPPTPFIQCTLLSAWKFPTSHSRSCTTSLPGSFPGSHSPVWSDLPISISWCMLHSSREQTLSDSNLANECHGADIGLILHYNFSQRTRLAHRSS